MRARQGRRPEPAFSGEDRGAIEEFLAYIEDRVKDVEPCCARLVRMARLALIEADDSQYPSRVLH